MKPLDVSALGFRAEDVAGGVWRVSTGADDESSLEKLMIQVSGLLGTVVSNRSSGPIQRLLPRERDEATPNSLSGRFGMGVFPLHTDLAQRPTPPRFVVLGAARVSRNTAQTTFATVPTLSADDFQRITSGIFAVSHGGRSFLTSICHPGRPFFRFDVGCMHPLDDTSRDAQSLFCELVAEPNQEQRIVWRRGDITVFDNWNVLHGRSSITNQLDDRMLLRVYVEV
jgi:L-asparagine oxygenase